jgi:hypothetical protein
MKSFLKEKSNYKKKKFSFINGAWFDGSATYNSNANFIFGCGPKRDRTMDDNVKEKFNKLIIPKLKKVYDKRMKLRKSGICDPNNIPTRCD